MNYDLRLLSKNEVCGDHEHAVWCRQCERPLAMTGDPGSMPDGPTVTPPGLDDDDFFEDEFGTTVWDCQLCKARIQAESDDEDEEEEGEDEE